MKIASIFAAGALVLASLNLHAASGKEDSIKRLSESADVLRAMQNAADHGIPNSVLDHTKCMVIIPNMVKGGFVFGGKHGRGFASCRTAAGWSAPAPVSIGGGSWGLQIGVQSADIILVVMNDKGVRHLLANKFSMSGEGAVAAGPIGRQAVAGTDWKFDTEILSYARTKGVFAGLTLEGSVIQQDDDSTKDLYGRIRNFRTILSGKVPAPAAAGGFINEINHAVAKAKAD